MLTNGSEPKEARGACPRSLLANQNHLSIPPLAQDVLSRVVCVPVTVHRYLGIIHGFFDESVIFDQGKAAIAEASAALRCALS